MVPSGRAIVKASLAPKFAENELAAHVNWYPGGKAGLAPHDDKEGNFVVDAPIFSFTLNRDAPPRGNTDHAGAQLKLGHCYHDGLGVYKNPGLALKLWRKCAQHINETGDDAKLAIVLQLLRTKTLGTAIVMA
jgi:TPR repeat protein